MLSDNGKRGNSKGLIQKGKKSNNTRANRAEQGGFAFDPNQTLPQLLCENYKRYADKRVAMREKAYGIWQPYTWKDFYDKVEAIFYGLMSLGIQPGDKVCILGDNAPEYYWAEIASTSGLGVVVPIYSDALPDEVKYIASHSESKFAFAEDQEQVDKFLQIREELPNLSKVIYWEPKGLQAYTEELLVSINSLTEQGKKYKEEHPGLFEQYVEKGRVNDLAVLSYTSGTSALPKGVMMTGDLLVAGALAMNEVTPFQKVHELVSFISPAWAVEQFLLAIYLQHGMTVNFCEKADTIKADLREAAPQFVFYTARLWEGEARLVQAKITDSSGLRKFMYDLFLPVGYAVADCLSEGKKPSLTLKALYFLANWIVFRPIKDELGLIKCQWGESSGSTISPDILRFFKAIGLNFVDSYSSTEVIQVATNTSRTQKSVIRRGVQVRITDEGEILVRADTCFRGYYKNPEETNKVLRGGWFYSGDAAFIDDEGKLVFLDRLSALTELTTGEKVAPQYIESRLKFSPHIKDAVIFASGKPYVSALVNIDFENVVKWAEAHKINFTTLVDLSQKGEVYELICGACQHLNRVLPSKTKIKKFTILHKDLDSDDAELTRTKKLRRSLVEERYSDIVNALYAEATHEVLMKAAVLSRDGRTGIVNTILKVKEVPTE